MISENCGRNDGVAVKDSIASLAADIIKLKENYNTACQQNRDLMERCGKIEKKCSDLNKEGDKVVAMTTDITQLKEKYSNERGRHLTNDRWGW